MHARVITANPAILYEWFNMIGVQEGIKYTNGYMGTWAVTMSSSPYWNVYMRNQPNFKILVDIPFLRCNGIVIFRHQKKVTLLCQDQRKHSCHGFRLTYRFHHECWSNRQFRVTNIIYFWQ